MAYLDDAGRQLVSEAVTAAESATSGEIVTVLADRSDGYTDVALLWAVGAAFTAMSVFAAVPLPFLDAWDAAFGGWDHEWTTGELASMVIALGLIKFVAVMLVQQWEPMKFFLIPGPLKTIRVHNQAVRQFKVGAEHRTTGRTGVMIYLSMRGDGRYARPHPRRPGGRGAGRRHPRRRLRPRRTFPARGRGRE